MVTAILSDSSAAPDSVPEYINLILSRLHSQFGCQPIIGVSRQCDKLSGISDCYQQSLTALKESIYHKDRQVFFYTPMMRSSISPCQYYSKELELLKTAISNCEPEKASEIIDGFFELSEEQGVPASAIYSFAVEIISYTGSVTGGNLSGKIPAERLHLFTDLNQISNYLKDRTAETIGILKESKLKNYGKIVSDILTYINMNIEKDLTINSVCSKFYINESYFCKLFKSKTGLSFNNYLTELKIKKAKDLLRYDNLRIYEVAKLVGFNDYKYFLKVFKKTTRETPFQFKDELSSPVLYNAPGLPSPEP
jgi:two-component system response regulator YesN